MTSHLSHSRQLVQQSQQQYGSNTQAAGLPPVTGTSFGSPTHTNISGSNSKPPRPSASTANSLSSSLTSPLPATTTGLSPSANSTPPATASASSRRNAPSSTRSATRRSGDPERERESSGGGTLPVPQTQQQQQQQSYVSNPHSVSEKFITNGAGSKRGSFRGNIFAGTIAYQMPPGLRKEAAPAQSPQPLTISTTSSDIPLIQPVARRFAGLSPHKRRRSREANGSIAMAPIANMILRQSSPSIRTLLVDPMTTPCLVVAGMSNGSLAILDVGTHLMTHLQPGAHAHSIITTQANRNGRIMTGSEDTLRIWDVIPRYLLEDEQQQPQTQPLTANPVARTSSTIHRRRSSFTGAKSLPTSPIAATNSSNTTAPQQSSIQEESDDMVAPVTPRLHKSQSLQQIEQQPPTSPDFSFKHDETRVLKCIHTIKLPPSSTPLTSHQFLGGGRLWSGDSSGLMRLYNTEAQKFRLLCEQHASFENLEHTSLPLMNSQPPPISCTVSFELEGKIVVAQEGVLKLFSWIKQDSPNAPAMRLDQTLKFEQSTSAHAHAAHTTAHTSHSAHTTHHGGHSGAAVAVKCMLALPDSGTHGLLITGHEDRSIRVVDMATFTVKSSFHGHFNAVTVMAELNDHRVVSGSPDSNIKIWNISTGRCDLTMRGHTGTITALLQTWHPLQLLSASTDRSVRLWNIASGACLSEWTLDHGLSISSLCLLPVDEVELDETVEVQTDAELEALRQLIANEAESPSAANGGGHGRKRSGKSAGSNAHSRALTRSSLSEPLAPDALIASTASRPDSALYPSSSASNSRRSTLTFNATAGYLGLGAFTESAGFSTGLTPSALGVGLALSPEAIDKDARIRERASPNVFQVKRTTPATGTRPATTDNSPAATPITTAVAMDENYEDDYESVETPAPGPSVPVSTSSSRRVSPSRPDATSRHGSPARRLFDVSSAVERASVHQLEPAPGSRSLDTLTEEVLDLTSHEMAMLNKAKLAQPKPAPIIEELVTFSPDELSQIISEKHRAERQSRVIVKKQSKLHEPARRTFKSLGIDSTGSAIPTEPNSPSKYAESTSPSLLASPSNSIGLAHSASEPPSRFQFQHGTMSKSTRQPLFNTSSVQVQPTIAKQPLSKEEVKRRKSMINHLIARVASPKSSTKPGSSPSFGRAPRTANGTYVLHKPSSSPGKRSTNDTFMTSVDGEDEEAKENNGIDQTSTSNTTTPARSRTMSKSSSAPSFHRTSSSALTHSSEHKDDSSTKKYVLGGVALTTEPPPNFNKKLYGHLTRSYVNPKTGGLMFVKQSIEEQLHDYLVNKEAPNVFNGFNKRRSQHHQIGANATGLPANQILEQSHEFMNRMNKDLDARRGFAMLSEQKLSLYKSERVLKMEEEARLKRARSISPVNKEEAKESMDATAGEGENGESLSARIARNIVDRQQAAKERKLARERERKQKQIEEEAARQRRLRAAEKRGAPSVAPPSKVRDPAAVAVDPSTTSPSTATPGHGRKRSTHIRFRLHEQITSNLILSDKQSELDRLAQMTEEEKEEYLHQKARAAKRKLLAKRSSMNTEEVDEKDANGTPPPPTKPSQEQSPQQPTVPGARLLRSRSKQGEYTLEGGSSVHVVPVREASPRTSSEERSRIQRTHEQELEIMKRELERKHNNRSPDLLIDPPQP